MNRTAYRPHLDCLEDRLTPAGSVTAVLLGRTLEIIGDSAANAIILTQTGPNIYTVASGDGVTFVNGSTQSATFFNVTGDIRIRLLDGNDSVRLGSGRAGELLTTRGNLIIEGGRGINAVDLDATLAVGRSLRITNVLGSGRTDLRGSILVNGDLVIQNGNGLNTTNITAALAPAGPFLPNLIRGNLVITNGVGTATTVITDTNVLRDVTVVNGGSSTGAVTTFFGVARGDARAIVGDDVTITTVLGRSDVTLADTNVRDAVVITGGRSGATTVNVGTAAVGGDMSVGGTLSITSPGTATVKVGDLPGGGNGGLVVGRTLNIATGSGNDSVQILDVQVARNTRVATNNGADVVAIDDATFFRAVDILTGNGNDTVQIERRATSAFATTEFRDRLTVNLGANDDNLLVGVAGDPGQAAVLGTSAEFFGGIGRDFRDDANLVQSRFRVSFVGFEIPGTTTLFQTPRRFTVGGNVLGVVTADFNRDGRPDVATTNATDGTVSILLGTGTGTFQEASAVRVGDSPQGLVAGDFNADGIPDLALTNNTAGGTVDVLLGNGDGTFLNRVSSPVGAGVAPVRLAVGDFNGDNLLDVATVNRTGTSSATVSILQGLGNGGFGAPTAVNLGAVREGTSIAAGDLNGDGRIDLVATTVGASATLLGNGDGTFQTPQVETQAPIVDALFADFNRDGRPDLVTGGNELRVRTGLGNGTFTPGITLPVTGVSGVAAGDFNGDGLLDLAATGFGSPVNLLNVFLGQGNGTFQDPLTFFPGPDIGPLALADFNNDGLLDLIIANQNAGSVSVLLNR